MRASGFNELQFDILLRACSVLCWDLSLACTRMWCAKLRMWHVLMLPCQPTRAPSPHGGRDNSHYQYNVQQSCHTVRKTYPKFLAWSTCDGQTDKAAPSSSELP